MYPDFNQIDAQTPAALRHGVRLMQSHKYGHSDADHVATLLDFADLPYRGLVVDMGCGIGEFARLASDLRPDLHWDLVNMSSKQLEFCPKGPQFTTFFRDAHHTGFAEESVGAVIFTTALVQMNQARALREAYRILKPGGVLFMSEMVRVKGDNDWWRVNLHGMVPTVRELVGDVLDAGFWMTNFSSLPADDSQFRELLGGDAHQLDDVQPRLLRAVKR
jgi:SAM-dependent methyltransferase